MFLWLTALLLAAGEIHMAWPGQDVSPGGAHGVLPFAALLLPDGRVYQATLNPHALSRVHPPQRYCIAAGTAVGFDRLP